MLTQYSASGSVLGSLKFANTVEAAYNDTIGTSQNCRYNRCVVISDGSSPTVERLPMLNLCSLNSIPCKKVTFLK